MAIIKCPECGHQVSEKAPVCPSCGVQIAGNVVRCGSCGCVYTADQPVCPNCQAPAPANYRPVGVRRMADPNMGYQQSAQPQQPLRPQSAVQPQQPQTQPAATPEQPKKSGHTALIISFIFALVVAGVAFYFYQQANEKKEMEDYEYAMQNGDALVLQQYLNMHKGENPIHCDSIQARLAALQQNDEDWTNACVAGTRNALEEYLQKHPDSPHKGEAENKIDDMDFAAAKKANTMESYSQYMQQHPNGQHFVEAETAVTTFSNSTVQPAESDMVKATFRRFFQSINARNEDALLTTVADQFTNLLTKVGAPKSDIITVMNKMYKDNVANLNFHILDDYQIEKHTITDGVYTYSASFTVEKKVENTDNTSETTRYRISGDIDENGRISSFKMTKLAQ